MALDPSEEIIDEYFEYLADRDVYRAPTVLSWLTDYIDSRSENAIFKLLQHSLAGEALAGLVDLLEFDDKLLTESVVHILGTIVEHPRCRQYVLEVPRNSASPGQNNPTLFTALVNMLMSDDKNVVMNAAGTIANIAESGEGRLWILQQAAFDDALPILGLLTVDSHQWAASNSALVIARLTLSQEGVVKMLTHDRSSYILTNLCVSLCGHNPGSSMNAAFAVGRLLEREDARSKLLAMKNFKNTMTAMTKMLYNKEAGPRKNACFAFSCLANSKEGHTRLLSNVNSELILDQLVRLITDEDDETAWFAAVTLRAVCSQKEGVFRVRDHKTVHSVLKKLVKGGTVKLKSELLTEVKMTLDIIGKLPKLPVPVLTPVDSNVVDARWDSVIATTGMKVIYQLYQGTTCVYEGNKTSTRVKNLQPFTSYVFRVRATSSADEGPYSGPAIVTTNEGVPGPPAEISNEGKPQHNAIKISWTPPVNPNGTLTGYNIYADGKRVAVAGIDKLNHVVRDLPHSTSISIQVAGVTSAGEGDKSSPILCSTLNLSDYPPRKPILSTSGGANEINVSWIDPPKQLGPVKHYELVMNGEVVYTGKDQGFRVSNLEPLAEYTFNVRVVTADDYVIESEPAKKKAGSKEDDDEEARRLQEEADRLRMEKEALEAKLREAEERRKREAEHRLTLGSRGGPSYTLDDPDIAACLSEPLRAKLKAHGINDLAKLDEEKIRALKLDPDELHELLDAVYLAKYLQASPALMRFLKKSNMDPLTLWKLSYDDVEAMQDLSAAQKKELFGHVLEQRKSFVANVEIPTTRQIILKGWKDENLAFLPTHDVRLVTKDFQAKEELNAYIDRLRAVVQKGGASTPSSDGDSEMDEAKAQRTPTPEVAKPISEDREIIRPKKKPDRFSSKKSPRVAENTSPRVEPPPGRVPAAPPRDSRQTLSTIEEVATDSAQTLGSVSPALSGTFPAAVSDVTVTARQQDLVETSSSAVEEESSASSIAAGTNTAAGGLTDDPRTTAIRSLTQEKVVQFTDTVRVNTANETPLAETKEDVTSCYVPNVLTAHVPAFDPLANISDTSISLETETHEKSVKFLVNYVTSYETKSEDGTISKSGPPNTPEQTENSFADKVYTNAIVGLEGAVQAAAPPPPSSPAPVSPAPADEGGVSCSLDSSDTTSHPKIAITSLDSIVSLETDSETPAPAALTPAALTPAALTPGPHSRAHDIRSRGSNRSRDSNRSPDEDLLPAVHSVSDIHLLEPDERGPLQHAMTIDKENEKVAGRGRQGYSTDRFSVDDVRTKDGEIETQNKLISALIAQQNNDIYRESRRTKNLIDTVRTSIRNSIHAKRGLAESGGVRQVSSNKFLHAVHSAKKDVKLSSVNMNMFGDGLSNRLAPRKAAAGAGDHASTKGKRGGWGKVRLSTNQRSSQLPPTNELRFSASRGSTSSRGSDGSNAGSLQRSSTKAWSKLAHDTLVARAAARKGADSRTVSKRSLRSDYLTKIAARKTAANSSR